MKRYYAIISIVAAILLIATVGFAEKGYEKFLGNDGAAKMPAGWSKGEKTGWGGQMLPPGLFKKLPEPAPEENPAAPEENPAAPEETPAAPEETPAAPTENPTEPNPLDVTGDGNVDMADVEAFQGAFGSKQGDENWDPKFDLNKDGAVNLQDTFILRGEINLPQNPE